MKQKQSLSSRYPTIQLVPPQAPMCWPNLLCPFWNLPNTASTMLPVKVPCTRYEFARTILEMAGITNVTIEPGLLEVIGRPTEVRCTLLRNLMMEMTGIYQMPHWKDALNEYMNSH